MRKGFLIITVVWAVFSCQEIKDCELETSRDYALVGFYEADSVDKEVKTVAFTQIAATDYHRYYISNVTDTLDDDTITATYLPLYSEAESITYSFDTDSLNYLLTIEYTLHLRIYYDECEPVFSYIIDTAYSDQFDSVAVIFDTPSDYQTGYNLEVYF